MNFIETRQTRNLLRGAPVPLYFSLLFSFFLLFYMAGIARPRLYGDAGEYFMMLQSFWNHRSFDLRQEDWKDLETLMQKERMYSDVRKWGRHFPYGGYYKSPDGRSYCYHFWLYPLVAYPAKAVLHFTNGVETKAFQITNAFLIGLLGVLVVLMTRLDPSGKLILLLLFAWNPALWYIHWPHPEVFSYFCVSVSLLAFLNQRYATAVFFSSLASTQNLPISFLTFFYISGSLIAAIRNHGWDPIKILSRLLKFAVCSLPALLPYVFYFSHFRKWSLIQTEGFADPSLISLRRICELLFDPNIGVFPYMPGVVIIWIAAVGSALYYVAGTLFRTRSVRVLPDDRTGSITIVALSLVLFAELAVSTAATNWNHGSSGPTRYLLWSGIPISLVTIRIALAEWKSMLLRWVLLLAWIVNVSIVAFGGGLIPSRTLWYTRHSYLSQFILNHFAALYHPSPEIFLERTSHMEGAGTRKPVIYRNENGSCKKAILRLDQAGKQAVRRQCRTRFRVDRCEKTGECYISFH